MNFFTPGIISILIVACSAPLYAEKVFTWTDANGNVHITDQPPPNDAEVRNVINYKPQPEKEVLEDQRRQESQEESAERKRKLTEARDAREKAQKSAEEARIAREKAEAAVKDANEYIDAHNRNQYMRRAYKYEMKKKSSDAEAAIEQANAAAEKARKAEARARRAEEELDNIDD